MASWNELDNFSSPMHCGRKFCRANCDRGQGDSSMTVFYKGRRRLQPQIGYMFLACSAIPAVNRIDFCHNHFSLESFIIKCMVDVIHHLHMRDGHVISYKKCQFLISWTVLYFNSSAKKDLKALFLSNYLNISTFRDSSAWKYTVHLTAIESGICMCIKYTVILSLQCRLILPYLSVATARLG